MHFLCKSNHGSGRLVSGVSPTPASTAEHELLSR